MLAAAVSGRSAAGSTRPVVAGAYRVGHSDLTDRCIATMTVLLWVVPQRPPDRLVLAMLTYLLVGQTPLK